MVTSDDEPRNEPRKVRQDDRGFGPKGFIASPGEQEALCADEINVAQNVLLNLDNRAR
jgi:hypothetical protein